jgi:hypothetical protein
MFMNFPPIVMNSAAVIGDTCSDKQPTPRRHRIPPRFRVSTAIPAGHFPAGLILPVKLLMYVFRNNMRYERR